MKDYSIEKKRNKIKTIKILMMSLKIKLIRLVKCYKSTRKIKFNKKRTNKLVQINQLNKEEILKTVKIF